MRVQRSRRSILSNVGKPVAKADYTRFCHNSNRSLCVRNLPFHYRDSHLEGLIRTILVDCIQTDVELCRVKYCREDGAGKPLHLGYVLMRTEELAQLVLERLGREPRHDGRDIIAERFNERATNSEQSYEGSVFFNFETDFNEPRITEEVIRSHLETQDGLTNLQALCIKAHYLKQSHQGQSGYGFLSFSEDHLNRELVTENTIREIHGVQYSFKPAGDNHDRGSSSTQHRRSPPDQRPAHADNRRPDQPPAIHSAQSSSENPYYSVTTPPMGYSSPISPYGTPPTVYQQQVYRSDMNVATSAPTWSSSPYYAPQSPSIGGARQYHPGVAPGHSPAYFHSMPSSESQRRGPPGGGRSARQHARYVVMAISDEVSGQVSFPSTSAVMYRAQPVYFQAQPNVPHMPSHHVPYQQYGGNAIDPQLSFSGDSSNSFSNHPSPRHVSPHLSDRAADWYSHPQQYPNPPYRNSPLPAPGLIAPMRAPLTQSTSVPSQAVAQGGYASGSSDFIRRDDESKVNESTA